MNEPTENCVFISDAPIWKFSVDTIFHLLIQPITDSDKQTTCAHGTAAVVTQGGSFIFFVLLIIYSFVVFFNIICKSILRNHQYLSVFFLVLYIVCIFDLYMSCVVRLFSVLNKEGKKKITIKKTKGGGVYCTVLLLHALYQL